MHHHSILLLAVISCLWTIGCNQESKTVVGPDGSKATVTQKGDGKELTYTGPKGETVRVAGGESGVALPDDFPKDVPIYPGAKVTTSANTPEMTSVVLTTTDPVKKVMDFYGEKLKAGGWDIQGTLNTEEGGAVTGTKGKSTCSVYVAKGEEQTTVTIGVGKGKE